MKRNGLYILFASALFATDMANADVTIDFENQQGYSKIDVYDVWEDSPFRTGVLQGNWAIVGNPNKESRDAQGDIANDSDKVLGAQRSRYGSNRFGVRIDLDETFPLTPTLQYVHVMMLKPQEGRVMLVGLGARTERLDQNPYTEQFWTLSDNKIGTGEWYDAVFPIKGAGGIDIRSLVVVPDCESPHNLDKDFLFYIDNIQISDSPDPRIPREFYTISGDKETAEMTRTDRYTSGISLTSTSRTQKKDIGQLRNKKLYQDLTEEVFLAKAGSTLTPKIDFTGTWMHAYCYIDYNNDGMFSHELNDDGTPAEGSEIVSYNYYQGRNSAGNHVSNNNLGSNIGTLPAFTLPTDLKPGNYRMRYKIDWNNIDPKGNSESGNKIADNGGIIADIMLCVYEDDAIVSDNQRNGKIVLENGTNLDSYPVRADIPLTVKVVPEAGFFNGGMEIRCGYNTDKDERYDNVGNPQYVTYTIEPEKFNADNTYAIPAEMVHANVLLMGKMIENKPDGVDGLEEDADNGDPVYYNLNGVKTLHPDKGIYVNNGKKIIVK